jgi:hypothetical protein
MLSEQLYRSARWLRVFVATRKELPRGPLLELLRAPAEVVRARVAAGAALLA